MSSVLVAAERSPTEPDSFEQRLFQSLPGNTLTIAVLIFAVVAGSLFLISWLADYPLLATNSFVLAPHLDPPIVISLLLATALGMRRYADMRQAADAPAYATIISSTAVQILDGHRLITSGPYRLLRHPVYTGGTLVFAGIGLAVGNWVSFAASALATLIAYVWRIHVEEIALRERFGTEFEAHRKRTWAVIPFLW